MKQHKAVNQPLHDTSIQNLLLNTEKALRFQQSISENSQNVMKLKDMIEHIDRNQHIYLEPITISNSIPLDLEKLLMKEIGTIHQVIQHIKVEKQKLETTFPLLIA